MKKRYSLELIKETTLILAGNRKIKSFIDEHQLDYFTFGIITPNSIKTQLENLLKNEGVFEDEFTLYYLENPEFKSIFTDFGFVTKDNKSYLYEELVIPFTILGYNKKDVKEAIELMDEHLVAIDKTEPETLYYAERYHIGLIEGIADAYNIAVTFYS